MSLITHRCATCGHPDFWRLALTSNERCPADRCGCRCTPGEPELAPTFDLAGRPVERITEPSKRTGFGVTTCSCDACKALYAELTGAA
jgi:hypothetical protein